MPKLLAEARFDETPARLPALSEAREIVADYRGLGIPMRRHPLALLRERLSRHRVATSEALRAFPDGRLARASGLVTHRQRPDTASGTIFVTLEDETGTVNVIVWPDVFERHRSAVLASKLMTVYGRWQRDAETGGAVRHLIAQKVVDHTRWLGELEVSSRDFR
jgi:error-prone DNA polymerase